MPKGRLIIFTGDGRGKTSAAFGVALRTLGAAGKVYIVQFLKRRPSGEAATLAKNRSVTLVSSGSGMFVKDGKPSTAEEREASRAFAALEGAVESGKYNLVIADEIFAALSLGMLSAPQVKQLAAKRHGKANLVFTGRKAPRWAISLADDASELKKLKHSFERGGKAQRGLEF